MSKEKYFGESALKNKPNKKLAIMLRNDSITVEKIAEEVWNKLKAEYLRLDGYTKMNANLNMNGHSIEFVKKLFSPGLSFHFSTFFQNYIELLDEQNGISFVLTKSSSTGKSTIKCSMNEYGEWTATGFKTTDQSSFGLLGNEGSVITAMTESDINRCISSVFG